MRTKISVNFRVKKKHVKKMLKKNQLNSPPQSPDLAGSASTPLHQRTS